MAVIKIKNFSGVYPKLDPRELPENAAQVATNVLLWRRILTPLKAPKLENSPTKTGTIKSVYRINFNNADFWLHWIDDVDAVRAPISDDTTKRLYYTGEGEPRVTNGEMASLKTDTIKGVNNYPSGFGETGTTDYPRAFYTLGVHNPFTKIAIGTITGGVGLDETRTYVYTFVTAWGEESGPSLPSAEKTGKSDGTWALSGMDVAPLNGGDINGADHVSGTITVRTTAKHWIRDKHKIKIAGVVGMTDLNATWIVQKTWGLSVKTTDRERTSNVAKLFLGSIVGFEKDQKVTVTGVGGTGYNVTGVAITAVDVTNKTITYSNTAADEVKTADTGGTVVYHAFTVAKTTTQSYTSGGTWDRIAPYNKANMTKRIYRSDGSGYLFVNEVDVAQTTHDDAKKGADLGESLSTIGFDQPPGDMIGIVSLPNGFFAGISSGKVLAFSEPYKPYGWPPAYQLIADFDGVGLGVVGGSVVMCTTALPYVASGVHPDSMTFVRLGQIFPCVSKRSVVTGPWGVAFASDQGIVLIQETGLLLVTEPFYDRELWASRTDAEEMISFTMDSRYYGFWKDDVTGGGDAIILSLEEGSVILTQNNFLITGAWGDPETGKGFVIDTKGIRQWDADAALKQNFEWKSKKYFLPKPMNFGAARVIADFSKSQAELDAIDTENATRKTDNQVIIDKIKAPVATSSRARATNVATIVTSVAHGILVGETIEILGLGGTGYNGSFLVVSVPNTTTFTYSNTGTDETTVADTAGFVELLRISPLEGGLGDAAIGVYAIGEDKLLPQLVGEDIQFQFFSDAALKLTKTVSNSKPFRLPAGFTGDAVEVSVSGNATISEIQLANTMLELQRI